MPSKGLPRIALPRTRPSGRCGGLVVAAALVLALLALAPASANSTAAVDPTVAAAEFAPCDGSAVDAIGAGCTATACSACVVLGVAVARGDGLAPDRLYPPRTRAVAHRLPPPIHRPPIAVA